MQIFEDIACTVCGCVCDDLKISVQEGKIVKAEGACNLAEPWFLEQETIDRPAAEIEGEAAPYDQAMERAAHILTSAKSPLIYGLSRSSTQGQRAALFLADEIGALIDTTASQCHAPSVMAIQQVGESTCTLGEIRHRADLVIFWGVNPVKSHPRHFERYSVDPPGMFLPHGRGDRTLVVIDTEPTESSEQADLFIQVEQGQDFEMIWTLRALIEGIDLDPHVHPGAVRKEWVDLAERMKACQCGVIFFGLGLAQSGLGHRNVEALLRLVTDLNAHSRFHARRMRLPGDVTGADNVLCWLTGFPFSVNLNRGYPRYNPGEYSANALLERGEVDACLLVGSEGISSLSKRAQAHLKKIPTLYLDYPMAEAADPPTVRFTTAVYGIHLPGTAYRMDEVPIPLRAVLPPCYPSDAEILTTLLQRLKRS